MADMVKVPGIGPVKKPMLIAGVGIVGGVLVYAYWKRSQAPAADPTEATPPDTSATGTDTTGYVEDSTAAGYNTVYPSAYSGGGYSPYGYDMYGNPLPPPVSSGSNGPYTTNADWATAAENELENGDVPTATSTLAISRVLGGLSVTSSQRDLFLQAVGILGQPPQGYPKPIKLTDSGTGSTPPPGGPLKAPTGLKVTHVDRTHVSLTWNKVPGATHYRVYRSDVSVNVGDSVDNSTTIGGLTHNHTYHLHVRAVDAHGHLGAASASVAARTKK